MNKYLAGVLSAICVSACAVGSLPVLAAPASFQQATQDYAAGKYALALSEFEVFKAQYPSNIQIHYYEALCYQAMAKLDKARTEYEYVAKYDVGRLKGLAQTALGQLSRAHGGGGGGGDGSASPGTPGPGGSQAIASASTGESKVRKVLEFYADW